MALSTLAKVQINRFLKLFNLRLETLTVEKLEAARLDLLERAGHFERPVFPVLEVFDSGHEAEILETVKHYGARFENLEHASRNDVGYTFNNDFFTSPDAEVLYSVVRHCKPSRVIEVGSGNSTQILRQAIVDGELGTRLICIDPKPRKDIATLADEMYLERVERLSDSSLFRSFKPGDILFIDSSHSIQTGNDVVFLYLILLPGLPSGALIHMHDVFLPYDYPEEWVMEKRFGWNEQYLVQALLMFTNAFEVIWAGHFLQRTRRDFAQHFPHLNGRVARSLWLRKRI